MTRNPSHFDSMLADVARFVREEAIPRENEIEQTDTVPADLVQRMRELGYFGWSIPRDFGGAGLSTEQLVRGAFELSQASVAFRARVGTNTGIGSEALVADGTDAQKQRYLPRLRLQGELTGRFRADRSGRRLRTPPRCAPPRARRRSLHSRRQQVLHHQRADRGPVHGDGPHRSRNARRRWHFRLSRRTWHARSLHQRALRQDGPGRFTGR